MVAIRSCDIDAIQTGNTPLHCAATNGYSSVVSDLISFGSDVNIINKVQYKDICIIITSKLGL